MVQDFKVWDLKLSYCVIGDILRLVESLEEVCDSIGIDIWPMVCDSRNIRRHSLKNLYHELIGHGLER